MILNFFNEPGYRYGFPVEGQTRCKHRMGGPARHKGIKDPLTGRSAIPIFEFDLSDIYLGIRIPRIKRLPIYYTFCANLWDFAYRVVSDQRIELILPKKGRSKLDAEELERAARFDARYSNGFPEQPQKIVWFKYNSLDPEHFFYRNIFQSPGLWPEEEKELLRGLNAHNKDFLKKPARSLEDAVSKLPEFTFPVGNPMDHCPEPECRKGKKDFMKLLLWLTPEEGEEPLYTAIAGGDSGILSVTWCTHCYAIRVNHQCT
jgi:hypothetical protein